MTDRWVWPGALLSGAVTAIILVLFVRPDLTPWLASWVVDVGIAAVCAVDTALMGLFVLPRRAQKDR